MFYDDNRRWFKKLNLSGYDPSHDLTHPSHDWIAIFGNSIIESLIIIATQNPTN